MTHPTIPPFNGPFVYGRDLHPSVHSQRGTSTAPDPAQFADADDDILEAPATPEAQTTVSAVAGVARSPGRSLPVELDHVRRAEGDLPARKRPRVTPSASSSVASIADLHDRADHEFEIADLDDDELAAYQVLATAFGGAQGGLVDGMDVAEAVALSDSDDNGARVNDDQDGINLLLRAASMPIIAEAHEVPEMIDTDAPLGGDDQAESDNEAQAPDGDERGLDTLTDGEVVDGSPLWADRGRFPSLSPDNLSQPYPGYAGTIAVEKPSYDQDRKVLEAYLNGGDSFRAGYKSDRMAVTRLTTADTETLGMPLVGIGATVGVRAKRPIAAREFLGIYEGALLTTNQDLESRLASMSGGQNVDRTKLIKVLHRQSWDLEHTTVKGEPIISAGSTSSDRKPVGCMLSRVSTAVKEDSRGKLAYNRALLNVECVPIRTDTASRFDLKYDMMAYYAKKRIPEGGMLCMDFGIDFLKQQNDMRASALTDAPQASRPQRLRQYDYDPARNGQYPLQVYNGTDDSIQAITPDNLQHVITGQRVSAPKTIKALVVGDDLVRHPTTGKWVWDGKTNRGPYLGTTIPTLEKKSVEFIKMDPAERAAHFDSLFKVKNGKVYTKHDVKQGAFLGLYAGVIFRLGDLSKVANQLGRHIMDVEEHALNLLDTTDEKANQTLISAQGAGNVLELVDFGEDCSVQARKVSIFSEKIGLAVPDTMLFMASKAIPAGTCLTGGR